VGTRRPDFFLVGAPKSGTTALSEYLRAHPDVFVSRPKEPGFFCEDLPGLPRVASLDAYLRLFRGSSARATGEASALYLYSRVALKRLRRFEPRARILVMLRNPLELAHAFHAEMLYSQNEDEPDFGRAWDLQAERRAGRRLPPHCWEDALLQYAEIARLGAQLERLLALFPREQVHVILFDDFRRDTRRAYEETLAFLGVASDGRRDFPPVNEHKAVRRPWLARLTQRPPAHLSRAARLVKRAPGLEQVSFLGPLRRANLRRASRPPLPEPLRARLAREFAGDVALLSRLLERDLGGWLHASG
jgi:hypothetical protein